ncbi:MAG: ATP-binding cassette domain-containing protein [Silvanigrellaceae bacterium]|nr:ATP-binding cassette domain-containing protein [Silvanigrellaceae bacterium]
MKKTFGKNSVLRGLNLKIPRGKISFIIGRSGEGKSVTIKHIVGILLPDEGEVIIGNQSMKNAGEAQWNKVRNKIGLLFQDGALFDSLTVQENVSFPLENHTNFTGREIDRRVNIVLEQVGLQSKERFFPSELSIGERKRVGLARALVLEPEILLYDEPTTGMDPIVAELIDHLIKVTQQNHSRLTTVVISHDIVSVFNLANHVFLLHQGKVYKEGSVEDFKNSTDKLVQQFLNGSNHGPLSVALV